MSRRKLRVAVLYNAPTLPREHPDHASEAGVVAAARAVALALRSKGMRAWPLAARRPVERLVRSLSRKRPDAVFNLIEGFGGYSGGEAHVTGLLEMMRLPYTGCPPEAQALARQKGATKALLLGFGLPTAPFAGVDRDDNRPVVVLEYPVIVKPEAEDASLGIDQASVVTDLAGLAPAIARLREQYNAKILVEEYLPGPEFNVGVLALPRPESLPVAEVVYDVPEGHWPILTYAAKWRVGSAEDRASPVRCPAEIEPALAERLGSLAVLAFKATGCRDYARVDFRLDARGEPMILEVNPNPDLDPTAGLARAIVASGRDYAETLAALIAQSLDRNH